jgi:hypothetical protein
LINGKLTAVPSYSTVKIWIRRETPMLPTERELKNSITAQISMTYAKYRKYVYSDNPQLQGYQKNAKCLPLFLKKQNGSTVINCY